MIRATAYFRNGIGSDALVEALKELPEPIRPVYFAADEGRIKKADKLTDEKRFHAFLKENALGFFLYTENNSSYDISTSSVGYAHVGLYATSEVQNDCAVYFLKRMAELNPVFGYACDYQEQTPDSTGSYVLSNGDSIGEYYHRNRHYFTIGKNHIESWIGRDLDKYIPGVYWLTLLSDDMLARHGVNVADLLSETVANETLENRSIHLLRFFDKPEDWRENAVRLDNLCERINGIFSRRAVDKALANKVVNYLEYSEIIRNWR
jgi:hypothetical protein